jgi:hypothetical protein
MAKSFKLEKNPTFKSTVSIPRIGGDPLSVSFTFKAFDRRGLAKVFDSWKKEHIELHEASTKRDAEGNPFTLEEWADLEIALQAKQVKDIVVGWGFSDEFNDENIEELVASSVSVTGAILDQYNEGYVRARSGN